MKKLLLTVIVSLAFCGSMFAQYNPDSHWPDFYHNDYPDQGGLVAAISIDGQIITAEYDGWDALEVAAFVGNDECRANWNFLYNGYVEEYGDPFPVLDGIPIYYEEAGDAVYFKMYNHNTGVEYTSCTVTLESEPFTVLTGPDNFQGWDDPDNPIFLNFTTPAGGGETFTKEIVGYGEGDNYWYFISSPVVEDVTPSAENGFFAAEEYDLFFFDQAQPAAEWQGYDVNNFVIENGKGYLYASKTNTTLTFTGTPNYGENNAGFAEVELTYDGNAIFKGWNLVGNPFADSAYADRPFNRLEPESGAYLPCTEDDLVPIMEGIFVESDGEDDELMAFYAYNDHTTPQDTTGGTGGGNIPTSKLVINVNQGRGICNRAILRFDGKAAMSKLQLNPNGTQVYVPVDGKDYGVACAPEMGEMPVNFKAGENGTYSLSFTNKEICFNYLHLIDNMTGADVNLLENPSYSFEATTSDYASRFKLVFATGNATDDSFAFFSNGNFIISNEGEAILQVVDVTGRILSSETINGSASVNVNAAPGVYMLRLINGDNVKVQKVVVR